MGELISRSEFEEQRRNRWLTLLFLSLGVVWTAGLGFWAVFSHISLFATLATLLQGRVPLWLSNQQILSWCSYGALSSVCLWLLISLCIYFLSNAALPKLVGATPASSAEGDRLKRLFRRVLASAGEVEPGPKLFLWPGPGLNAFAAGRSPQHGSIVVTAPLMAALSDDELEAVLGHELAHLKHRDSVVMVQAVAFAALVVSLGYVAAGLVGLVAVLFVALMAAILGLATHSGDETGCIALPLALGAVLYLLFVGLSIAVLIIVVLGTVVVLVGLGIKSTASSLAQSREYLADARAAAWTGRPELMAGALRKVAGLQSAPMTFMSALLQPLMLDERRSRFSWKNAASWLGLVLRTHPLPERRIAALAEMAGGANLSASPPISSSMRVPGAGRWGWLVAVAITIAFAIATVRVAPTAGSSLRSALASTASDERARATTREVLDIGFVSEEVVRLRGAPSVNATVVASLRRCTGVEILETTVVSGPEREWYRVRLQTSPHLEGWIAKRLVVSRKNYFPGLINPLDKRSKPPC